MLDQIDIKPEGHRRSDDDHLLRPARPLSPGTADRTALGAFRGLLNSLPLALTLWLLIGLLLYWLW